MGAPKTFDNDFISKCIRMTSVARLWKTLCVFRKLVDKNNFNAVSIVLTQVLLLLVKKFFHTTKFLFIWNLSLPLSFSLVLSNSMLLLVPSNDFYKYCYYYCDLGIATHGVLSVRPFVCFRLQSSGFHLTDNFSSEWCLLSATCMYKLLFTEWLKYVFVPFHSDWCENNGNWHRARENKRQSECARDVQHELHIFQIRVIVIVFMEKVCFETD